MSNPLFNALGGGVPAMPGPMGNMMKMMQRLSSSRPISREIQSKKWKNCCNLAA